MARQSGYQSHDSGWQDLAWAGVAAALVTLVLVVSVALAWLIGGGPSGAPSLTVSDPLTPTPRAIAFTRSTPIPTPPAEAAADSESGTADGIPASETADLMSMETEGEADLASDTTFEATTSEDFMAFASGSWTVSENALINDGAHAVAERWLPLDTPSGANFAVEADMRVTSVLDSVCDQSFGIIGGSPASGLVYGGGVIFPCSGGEPEARVSNITDWEGGYNVSPVVAEQAFTPGDKWHTYRFELRDGSVRLLVDGVGVVSGQADPGVDPAASDAEAGLWSQGVGLEVKRVAVYPLPE